jgi:hypothetical protein
VVEAEGGDIGRLVARGVLAGALAELSLVAFVGAARRAHKHSRPREQSRVAAIILLHNYYLSDMIL